LTRVVSDKKAKFWKSQLPVDYIDTSLVINTWETVSADLSEGKPARLLFIIVEQTNNGAAVETVELEITINGTAYVFTGTNMPSGTVCFGYVTEALLGGDFLVALPVGGTVIPAGEGYSATITKTFNASRVGLIRARQTSAVDATSAQIEVNIIWDKLVIA